MVARGPGAVGCAHCKQLGAERPCGVCKHLVCERCGADWTTCAQPCSRMFQLPRGERLLDVDPSGRYGLAARDEQLRYLDLRAARWLAGAMAWPDPAAADASASVMARQIVVRTAAGLTAAVETTGTVRWVAVAFPYLAALVRGGAEDGLLLWSLAIPTAPSMRLHLAAPVRLAALSRDGRYLAAAFEDHRVFVRDIEGGGSVTFAEHRAPVGLLRFTGDGELVTADEKGGVVLRAHGAAGFVRELVEVPLRAAQQGPERGP